MDKDKRDPRTAGGTVNKSNSKSKTQKSSTSVHTVGVVTADSQANKKQFQCSLCQAKHTLNSCTQFNSMSPQQRFDLCKKSKLCINCLHNSHSVSDCKSSFRCLICKSKHHTKLHLDNKNKTSSPSTDEEKQEEITSSSEIVPENTTIVNLATAKQTVLLATARICVSDSFGKTLSVRALIDPGAQRSFITERLAKQLSLDRRSTSVAILGVGGQTTSQAHREASISISSQSNSSFQYSCVVLILNELTCLLPPRDLSAKEWPHLRGLQLADPSFASPGKVDAILGADVYGLILQEGFVRGPADAPVAQSTVFGWVLTGVVHPQQLSESSAVTAYHTATDSTLPEILTKFWEIEELPGTKGQLSPEEEYCEQYFSSTYSRNSEGRFVVRLPFARREPFVDSRDIAVACLVRSEKRRRRNPELQSAYCSFMQEYEQLGHMRAVPPLSNNHYSYYFPHHAVFRAESNKIRVVFNASQKGAAGYSLNDILYPGPKLQSEITIVITDWRFDRVVIVTDIVKMFRQSLVHPDDLDWQRLNWRELPTLPIQDYQALTVTYGTTCAPLLALRVLKQLARDGQLTHPRAARVLLKKSYVDDMFLGDEDEAEVQAQRDELIDLLGTAGMELGKWASNQPELLRGLCNENVVELPTTSGEIVSTLGLKWDTRSDTFLFQATLPPISSLISKRALLSDTARLYDPLGFIAPVLIKAKILLQDLWIHQLDWDVPLSGDLLERWLSFRSALSQLADIRIPRWTGVCRNSEWHLHGFADASKRAYAAVVYAVIPGISSVLLMAKTRVAPVKVETIPRLELCGATLLVLLAKHLLEGLSHHPASTNFWTDSKVVLDWLKSHPSRWPTFVANRVSKISTTFPSGVWRHVPTKDNPADCASRGTSPQELAGLELWWQGPKWIIQPTSDWPSQPASQILAAVMTNDDSTDDEFFESLKRFSSFPRLVRVLAYCLRWKNLCFNKEIRRTAGLSVLELTHAKRSLLKLIQSQYFASDIKPISRGQAVSSGSSLVRLAPFLDDHGLLRVGGRLQHASLPYAERHPIILPRRCFLVRLLVEDAHRITLHGGVQLMKSFLLRSYWIVRGQRLIVHVYRSCVKCLRFNSTPMQQQMAPLPEERLMQARPFAITARRGLCSILYSDNGTTFKGAAGELKRLFEQSSTFAQEIFPQLSAQGTEWRFIPPRAPHFGGLWEAAVRCFKYHLRRVVGKATFTFEEFNTLSAKIEACLNSRPLCPLSNEANDPVALTPGHFLVGASPLAYPEPVQDINAKVSSNKRWQLINQLRDSFWVRWRKEVLNHLQQRNKWFKPQPNLKEGDLVILTDELAPPAAWPFAIVTKTHPGEKQLVRVVTLRTAKTELVRPVAKLVRLPVEEAAESTFVHFSAMFAFSFNLITSISV